MVRFQIVIDCHDADRLSRFWTEALGYVAEPPPTGFTTWDDYWRDVGLPETEAGGGVDRIIDPSGEGPRIWFQVVDEPKLVKNRLHLDLTVSGGRSVPMDTRKERVEAESRRLVQLGAKRVDTFFDEGVDHYAVAMRDPEGNEFDIN